MVAHLDGEIHDGRHTMAVRVYYEDTDFTGIVYHASYLRFMERGRTNYLRLIGANHREMFEQSGDEGFAFVVRSMNIDWLKPAKMDDVLDIVTMAESVKGASVVLRQECRRENELLCGASVRFAIVAGGRARPIPDALRAAMQTSQTSQTRT
jgi:acyl-CoA thioester hydrolase